MDKKKKPIDVSKYQKGGPIILDEVTVVDSAPSWLRYKREYEENNPKEKFIESYLNPFAKSLGNTKANYPKRLDTEYEKQALDFVAERLLDPAGIGSFKTKTKADRLSLYDRFSDKEREIIKNSKYANRFLPAERENSIRISDATQYKNKDKNVFDYSTEDVGLSVEGTPNRFRLAANARTNFEDYINPGIWVGEMAKNLGQSLSPMEEGNYKPAISAIAAPLALGALGFSPVHSLAKGIDKGIANVASKKELYLRGYNEGNVGVNIKPVSKTLSKDEFTKLRDIQSLKSLSMEPEIKRETLVKRYLKSSLDDVELKRLTSKTRQELEGELEELTAVKKSSEETVESVGSYVRPEQVTQELYRRPQLPPLPDYVNLPNLRNVRNGYDFNLDRTYRTIINPNQDLQYYINQHNNNRGVGTKVMQALDMPVVDILPTAPNISNMIYKAGKKHGARKSELNMDKTLVSLNTTNENPKPLLPTLFKTVSSQKDVMRKINDAFATLKSSEKGLYDASGSLSDSSAPLYYRKASSLSNTPKIDFEFKGFNSLNDFGHLKKSGVENEKILDFINTQIKDLDFNGKKLPAAYLDKFGNIQIPELVIRKFQQGGKVNPIYVTDPNDPRLIAYQDSTDLYDAYQFQKSLGYAKNFANNPANSNKRQAAVQAIERATGKTPTEEQIDNYTKVRYGRAYGEAISPASDPTLIRDRDKQFANFVNNLDNPNVYIANRDSPDLYHKTIMPTGYYSEDLIGRVNHKYEKPIQPVELKNNITGDHKMISKMPQKRKEIPILDTTVHIVYDENGNPTNDRWRFNSKLVSKPLPKRDKVNINRIGSVSPITYVGTSSSRETKGPNITEHNVLGDQVFIPVTRSGSYQHGEPVGSDRIIRYETPDGSKSYTKKEYEKLKKGQVKSHKCGGKVKKYPGGGSIGNYPDAINNWKEYNNYVPTNDPVVVPFTESAEVPFIQASPYMGALLEGNMNEKNMKRSDVFNPIQGFHGYNYQMGGDVNVNTSGYTPGYPSFDNPENTIPLGPSKTITMKNTPFPVLAIPDVGEPVILKPGEVRKFKDATKVREIPMKNNKFQLGGTSPAANPQGQPSQNPFDNIPNKFNNQSEDPFVLGSYLPYILGDSRNTLNAGKRPLAPIQTEDGEMITSPLGDIVDVAATKAHKNMESDEITDFSAEGNYILSDDKNMIIKKGKDGGVVNGINLKDVLIGMDAMYYKEGELIKTPKEYTLEDIAPKKSKYTFAELGKNVQRHFPLSTEENDIFAKRAQVENKLSRVPYINSIIELSEIKKQSMNKKGSPANFKQGGYASMAKIYNPALKSLGNTLADGSTNGFYFEPDPQLNPKRDNNFKTPTYQRGGYTYDDRERGQNKREQWNYWINQTQDHFNDFEQDSQRNNQAMFGVNALGILGQGAYQGDNDYLYGNTYNSKMDNLSNKVDRSFGAEQSYNEGLVGRENSAYRMGLNSGATPNDFAPSRANALREQGSMNNNLNKERRSYMDRYGTMDAQSSDMFAGRRNQQKAYLNDFSNNQVQNLAGAGTGYLQNKIGIQAANLQAQSSLQLMKQAGNGWTDFTNGLGDVITAVSGILGSIYSGSQGAQFDKGKQTPQQQQTMDGLNPNNWGGSNMFQNNTQLYNPGNPFSGYNPNSQPYQPSWNENRGWGSGGPG